MRIVAIALLAFHLTALTPMGTVCAGQFVNVRQASIYADVKARGMGDVLTVAIVEQASASNSSRLTTRRSTKFADQASEGEGVFGFFPELGVSAQFGRDHEGTGVLSREGRLTARMAVTVIEVRDNGDLVIEGERRVTINEEEEILTLRGTVRPEDIGPENIVYSTDIADADISYKGKGVVTSGSRPNILVRILSWIF